MLTGKLATMFNSAMATFASVPTSSSITGPLSQIAATGAVLLIFFALILYGVNKTQSGNGGAVSEGLMMGCVLGAVVLMIASVFIRSQTLF